MTYQDGAYDEGYTFGRGPMTYLDTRSVARLMLLVSDEGRVAWLKISEHNTNVSRHSYTVRRGEKES